MTIELPEDNKVAARLVTRACRKAALSTLDKSGAPYVSMVTVAFDHDLSPILIVSDLSAHTRNMKNESRVCFLFDGTEGHPNPQTGPRFSMQGHASRLEASDEEARLRARFLARNPGAVAVGYTTFADFSLWRIVPSRGQFVGGFGRAMWIDAPFGLTPDTIRDFQAGATELLERIRANVCPDAVSVDPDGYDVVTGEIWNRVAFANPVQVCKDALTQLSAC